jgi:hypothetical protein
LSCDDLDEVGLLVHDWLRRPRMSRRHKKRVRGRKGGPDNSSSEVRNEPAGPS